MSEMEIGYVPEQGETWDKPKQLEVMLDGEVLARGKVTAFRMEGGTHKCSDPECIGHLMPDEYFSLTAIVAPPQERGI